MTSPRDRCYDTDLLASLSERILMGDGAMGTQLQAADLTLDDFCGVEVCNEILNETRPGVLGIIHHPYFEAGAGAGETNTFGCNLSSLGSEIGAAGVHGAEYPLQPDEFAEALAGFVSGAHLAPPRSRVFSMSDRG